MMGLTFLIGFFVAAVIKLIAYAADSFDFYSSHRLETVEVTPLATTSAESRKACKADAA